jgi:hypothetical protein
MLASTVQFSNNDQPPITPPLQASSLGPATEGSLTAIPSDTQQRARPDRSPTTFHAEAVLAVIDLSCRIVNVPPMSNQHRTFAGVLASDPENRVRSAP